MSLWILGKIWYSPASSDQEKIEQQDSSFAITDIGIRLFMVFTWKNHMDKVNCCGMRKTKNEQNRIKNENKFQIWHRIKLNL